MGDGADQALERAANESELYDSLQNDPEGLYEAGFIDESGSTIGNPGSFPTIPLTGRIANRLLENLF